MGEESSMKKTTINNLLIGLCFMLFLLTSLSAFVYPLQETTTLSVAPSPVTASVGQNFSINVTILSVVDLYGWEFKLGWNASLLDAVNVVEGPFLKTEGSTFFTYTVNATEGYMIVDCTLLGIVPGVSGDGTLATMTFYVKDVGECLLDLYDVILLNSFEQPISCQIVDGYGYFTPPHDVAVTNVSVSPITVLPGDIVNVNVTVQNQGGFAEEFNVTAYSNLEIIGIQFVSLDSGSSTTLLFVWDTTDFGKGDYVVSVSASVVPDETDTADNNKVADEIVTVLYYGHDIAVINVAPSKTVVGQGYSMYIVVTVKNYGIFGEDFETTVYANTTAIQTQAVILASGENTKLTFTWNTSDFIRAYIISANATTVPSETNTNDNAFIDGIVKVSCIGDINGDYVTDGQDFQLVKRAVPSTPGDPDWNPNSDINNDGITDGQDYQLVKRHIPSYA